MKHSSRSLRPLRTLLLAATLVSGAGADTITGRLVNQASQPLAGIDLDFFDANSGDELLVSNDRTDANGDFDVTVPAGALLMDIRPLESSAPLYAPQRLSLNVSGTLALGAIVVRDGFFVSATLRRSNGSAVSGADGDAQDISTGVKLYTPGDNSDGSGFAQFVVPSGTYAIDFCPPSGVLLAPAVRRPVSVSANTNLGIVTLPDGVVLTGRVTDKNGAGFADADVDVDLPNNGGSVPTCDDNTDGNGFYLVIVPTGTYDVTFSVPQDPSQGAARRDDVVVNANTTTNGTLPGVEATRYCVANVNTSGAGGCIYAAGSPDVSDADFTLLAAQLPTNKTGLFFFGPNQVNNSFGEGRRCVGGSTFRLFPFVTSSGAGTASRSINFSNPGVANRIVPGASLNFQLWFRDPMGGPNGFNLTDGLNVVWR